MHRLTLSFDNGPFADVTPGVLEVLARYGIRAYFFVCGNDIRSPARRAITAQAKARGIESASILRAASCVWIS